MVSLLSFIHKQVFGGRVVAVSILAVLLSAVAAIAPVYADAIDLSKIPHMKEYPAGPAGQFEAETRKIEETNPYNDPALSYMFRAPKDWSANVQKAPAAIDSKVSLSPNFLGILGRYIGPARNLVRSRISVEAQALGYEISAKSWFVNFIQASGFTLSSLTVKSAHEIEGLYVEVDDDQSMIVRVRVLIEGSRLVMFRYYLPQENYETEKIMQAEVVQSFALSSPATGNIEKRETYGFLDQSFFDYPTSWALQDRSILSVDRMSATLLQQTKEGKVSILEGQIRINAISRLLGTSLADEVQKFRAGIKVPNYKLGNLIEPLTFHYDASIKLGQSQIYELEPLDSVNYKSYEMIVTVMQSDDYYYITSMITPSRDQDYYVWARNMEAVRIVNESLRRNNTPAATP